MSLLHLYPDYILPKIKTVDDHWNPFKEQINDVFAAVWLEAFDGYHFGNMMAYMMRAYGYPNTPAGNPFDNNYSWALATKGGHILLIQSRPLILMGYSWQSPKDRGAMVKNLSESGTFKMLPGTISPNPLSTDFLSELCHEFAAPVYVGEQGFNVLGIIPPEEDIGMAASDVKQRGVCCVNLILNHPDVCKEEDANSVRLPLTIQKKILI